MSWMLVAGTAAVPLLIWLMAGLHGLGANYIPSFALECADATGHPNVGYQNIRVFPWAIDCLQPPGEVAYRSWSLLLIVPVVFGPPSLAVGLVLFLAWRNRMLRRRPDSETTHPVANALASFAVGIVVIVGLVVVYFVTLRLERQAGPWGQVLLLFTTGLGLLTWTLVVRAAARPGVSEHITSPG